MTVVGWTRCGQRRQLGQQPTPTAGQAGPAGAAFSVHSGPATDQVAVRGAATQTNLAVAFEGRLTNHDRLAHQLGRHHGESSAEVVLAAYRRWGPWLVDRIEGTFAIAIWDGQRDHVLLVSDPLGAKTWLYHVSRSGLIAATTLRGLLAHASLDAVVDADGLNELLTLGPVYTPGHGVLRGVSQLPAAHLAHVATGQIRSLPYRQWHPDPYRPNVDDNAATVRQFLADATMPLRERPASTVLLSGGVASAVAAAFATHGLDPQQRPTAYTLTLTGPWNQPPGPGRHVTAAVAAATHLDLPHQSTRVHARDVLLYAAHAREVLNLPGEPGTDALSLTLLRHIATASVSAVSGDGAAGVFGDYPWLHHGDLRAEHTFPWHRRGHTPGDLLTEQARAHLRPSDYLTARSVEANDTVTYLPGDDAAARAHRRAAHLTLSHYLPAHLHRADQLATATSVTVYTPYAHRELAQYLYTVPYPLRHLLGIRHGLLRHATADLLPAEIAWKPDPPAPSATALPAWHAQRRDTSKRCSPIRRNRCTRSSTAPASPKGYDTQASAVRAGATP
ncbi:asparagine synthase-related protein [Actinoplanes sp. CA-131856]